MNKLNILLLLLAIAGLSSCELMEKVDADVRFKSERTGIDYHIQDEKIKIKYGESK